MAARRGAPRRPLIGLGRARPRGGAKEGRLSLPSLISAAQQVEHYEIAAYGTARTLAGELDLNDAKDLLDQTLDEESNADKLLTKIATGGMLRTGINQQAR